MELVETSTRGENQFNHMFSGAVIVITITLAIFQLYTMNLGLKNHPSLVFLPFYQAGLVIYASIAGIVYFDEGDRGSMVESIPFISGILITVLGLVAFACSNDVVSDAEDSQGQDVNKVVDAQLYKSKQEKDSLLVLKGDEGEQNSIHAAY